MQTILCFSTVDWDHLWHRPQALMSYFARDGYRVLYVDTLGLRSPKVRDIRRIVSRLRNWTQARRKGFRRVEEGIQIYSPVLLPFLNSRLARRINVEMLISAFTRALESMAVEGPILWVYLPTWTVLQCIDRLPHRMLVYDCIDALAENPGGVSRDYEASERAILSRADLVLATSETLYRQKQIHNPHTYWAPSGVPSAWFEKQIPSSDLEAISRPRIGFFGTLDHRIDLRLLKALSRAHKDWSFVFIGVARADLSDLLDEANVYFLGHKDHSELPNYLAGLDAFILPYVSDSFTRHVHPAKLYECLAFGKPVVATRLPALEAFEEVVSLASGIEEFDRALGEAVAEARPDLQARRREVARANSWERRYQEIRTHVEGG